MLRDIRFRCNFFNLRIEKNIFYVPEKKCFIYVVVETERGKERI